MFDWFREAGIPEHYMLEPMYCPECGEYGAMYLIIDTASKVWAMCDECERLWDPLRSLDPEEGIWDQNRVDSARLAKREDVERAGLTAENVRRLTTQVRGGP